MIDVHLVEYGICRYPPGMEKWRCFRIEYHAEDQEFAVCESQVWLPPEVDPEAMEDILSDWRKK